MEQEFFQCGLCSLIFWDPVLLPCCKYPACYSCLLSLESEQRSSFSTKSPLHCVYCDTEFRFLIKELQDVEGNVPNKAKPNIVEIELEKLKGTPLANFVIQMTVSKFLKNLTEKHFGNALKERVNQHLKEGLRTFEKRKQKLDMKHQDTLDNIQTEHYQVLQNF